MSLAHVPYADGNIVLSSESAVLQFQILQTLNTGMSLKVRILINLKQWLQRPTVGSGKDSDEINQTIKSERTPRTENDIRLE